MLVILLAMFFAPTAGVYPSGRVRGSAKGGRAPMVPFPLSRSPHPSSGPFPTYRKPARPAPPGRAAQRLAKRLRCSGLPRGRFFVLRAAPVPARYNPFRVWRRGASCAAAPADHPAGSIPFAAAPLRPPPPDKARRGPQTFLRRMSARPHAILRSIKFEKRVDFSAVLPYNIRRE